jgi:hypothetical protein
MKVYKCPTEVPPPTPDYTNFDLEKELAEEKEHQTKLKAWLIKNGYTGKNTGKIVSFGVADGHAQYMLAEGKKSLLIHLPYGDAWQYRDVEFLPKKEILKRIQAEENLAALFTKKD